MDNDNLCGIVPLIEQLRRIPVDVALDYDDGTIFTHLGRHGQTCHDAADRIEELERQLKAKE